LQGKFSSSRPSPEFSGVWAYTPFYEKESEKKGTMTFATYTKIMKCLHPDTTPTPGQRTEACGLLSQWQQSARSKRDAA
jgi:hypothetical protein